MPRYHSRRKHTAKTINNEENPLFYIALSSFLVFTSVLFFSLILKIIHF